MKTKIKTLIVVATTSALLGGNLYATQPTHGYGEQDYKDAILIKTVVKLVRKQKEMEAKIAALEDKQKATDSLLNRIKRDVRAIKKRRVSMLKKRYSRKHKTPKHQVASPKKIFNAIDLSSLPLAKTYPVDEVPSTAKSIVTAPSAKIATETKFVHKSDSTDIPLAKTIKGDICSSGYDCSKGYYLDGVFHPGKKQ